MNKSNRRKHTAAFKSKVSLEALKERESIAVLSQRFGLHSTQINNWKSRAIEIINEGFEEKATKRNEVDDGALTDELYRQIGQLSYELQWLKKKVGPTS